MNYENPALSNDRSATGDGQPGVSRDRALVPADDTPRQTSETKRDSAVRDDESNAPPKDSSEKNSEKNSEPKSATVVVRGELVQGQDPTKDSKSDKDSQSKDSQPKNSQSKDKQKSAPKPVSEAKVKLQSRLPALEDDSEVGVEKDQVVTRDGKPDLAFKGTLIASVGPPSAPKGNWQEYRVYQTAAGKHVFSKVTRSIYADDQDKHEAEVFDDTPESMPSQLLRTARDLARSKPLTWTDAAAAYFGYDPLAKALYRKLGGEFEEHIS
jgi:hypothetical protein